MAQSNNTIENDIIIVDEEINVTVTEEELVNPAYEPHDEFYQNPSFKVNGTNVQGIVEEYHRSKLDSKNMTNVQGIVKDYERAKLALTNINYELKRDSNTRFSERKQNLVRDIELLKDGHKIVWENK